MNAEDIVKVLRHCYSEDIKGCNGCPLNENDLCYEANPELSAADLIESLQKQLNDMTDTARQNYCKFVRMSEERDELQNELAESQRRERAAVEDLTYFAGAITTGEPCSRCIYNPDDMGCELDGSQYDDDGECHFTWRGPQEGEPHETV